MIIEEILLVFNIDVLDFVLEWNVDIEKLEEVYEFLMVDIILNIEIVEVELVKNIEKYILFDINEEFNCIKGVIVVNGWVL